MFSTETKTIVETSIFEKKLKTERCQPVWAFKKVYYFSTQIFTLTVLDITINLKKFAYGISNVNLNGMQHMFCSQLGSSGVEWEERWPFAAAVKSDRDSLK